ncbi:hypothetical protein ACS0TY_001204 [Phlomoides rotata]
MGDFEQTVKVVSSLLQRVAETNDAAYGSCLDTQKMSIFHGFSRPTISIESYLERIVKYANCSPCCFIVAYIYLDRFTQRQPFIPINSFNLHRLLIASVLVSAKFMDDMFYNNAYYSKVGGITTVEMNLLELDFLFGMGFQLNVSISVFEQYNSYLQHQILIQFPPLMHQNHQLLFHNLDEDESTHQQQLAV